MRNHTVIAHGQYFRVNVGKPYANMSSRSGNDESDLDLGLPPDINLLLSPFHRWPSDKSSGQDVDATVSALSVPQVPPLNYDHVMNALLESKEVSAPPTVAVAWSSSRFRIRHSPVRVC